MKDQKRIREYGIHIGRMESGQLNSITDVKGIKVGHCTVDDEEAKTGVTVILPCDGDIFKEKMMAACHVINGFGKTTGSIQIEELGTLETPIVLTNTLSVGTAEDALIEYMLNQNEDIGLTAGTVNPVICECNDGYLNSIRKRRVKKEHIFEAIQNADSEFEEGSVGAGRGMSCFGLKGGIGTASRIVELDQKSYTVGVLVLTNFGRKKDLIIDGIYAGEKITAMERKIKDESEEKGSIIVIIATDIPCSERQLKRLAKRAFVGIARTGGQAENGSGEVVISFSTANKVMHNNKKDIVPFHMIHDNSIDGVFRAVVESVEEAILNSMICSDTTQGRDRNIRYSLKNYINLIGLETK